MRINNFKFIIYLFFYSQAVWCIYLGVTCNIYTFHKNITGIRGVCLDGKFEFVCRMSTQSNTSAEFNMKRISGDKCWRYLPETRLRMQLFINFCVITVFQGRWYKNLKSPGYALSLLCDW